MLDQTTARPRGRGFGRALLDQRGGGVGQALLDQGGEDCFGVVLLDQGVEVWSSTARPGGGGVRESRDRDRRV